MSPQILQLDRIEFLAIKVTANDGKHVQSKQFPQLECSVDDFSLLTRSDLFYPEEDAADPRFFVLAYGVKVSAKDQESADVPPYEIEVEVLGYFHYTGDEEFSGVDRFRAVRFSGYQILYGAIREMVSNLTARSRHGLWHLPARNFGAVAKARAEQDEQQRQQRLASQVPETAALQVGGEGREEPTKRAPRKRSKSP